jgi:P27 family predicted phage terminase small subunit
MRKAPEHLSPASRRLHDALLEEFDPSDGEYELLVAALDARDLMIAAREQIAKDGLMVEGSKGHPANHPCVLVARDARTQYANFLRQLGLDRESR